VLFPCCPFDYRNHPHCPRRCHHPKDIGSSTPRVQHTPILPQSVACRSFRFASIVTATSRGRSTGANSATLTGSKSRRHVRHLSNFAAGRLGVGWSAGTACSAGQSHLSRLSSGGDRTHRATCSANRRAAPSAAARARRFSIRVGRAAISDGSRFRRSTSRRQNRTCANEPNSSCIYLFAV
jgi:hypothetical protein